jgi:predicted enzyme related to lactoylglutathione lyase
MMVATFGIGKIVLYANDPEAISAFYTRLVGISFERVEGACRYEAKTSDGTVLAIEATPVPLRDGSRDCWLALRVADLEAARERIGDAAFMGPVRDLPEGHAMALHDPEGRAVELWAPRAVEKPARVETESRPPPAGEPAPTEAPIAPPPLVEKPVLVDASPVEAPSPVGTDPPSQPAVEKPALLTGTPFAPETAAVSPEELSPPPMVGAPGPLVSAVRPGKLPTYGGARLTVVGANFSEACKVLIDGEECPSLRRVDAFTLEVMTPAHEVGSVELAVENEDGQRAVARVIYAEGPVIGEFSPLEGSPRGGTEVIVEGRNFQDGCMVTFFGNRAPEAIFESDRRIRFVTPPQEGAFHGELRVTNPDGLSATASYLFTYRLATPRILTVSPATGLIGGGKRIAVTGEDFHPQCVGRIGSKGATLTFRGPNAVDLVTPQSDTIGPVDVVIENPDGQIAVATEAFTYEPPPAPPMLIEVRPPRGFCAGGQTIRLLGENFEEDTVVRIGEVRAVMRFKSRNELEVETPPHTVTGIVAIELIDRNGVVVRREDGFTYESRPVPRIDSITPRNGPMLGGTRVVVEGAHFPEGANVRIGGQAPKKAVVRNGTVIEIIMPPSRAPGFVDIDVGRAETGTAVVKNAFRYDPSPAPSIETVGPNKGSVDGGTEVSIGGKNFASDATVHFGGKPATHVKFVDASTIEAKTPPGNNGEMVDVVVKNPDGKEAVVKRAFQYDARYR